MYINNGLHYVVALTFRH